MNARFLLAITKASGTSPTLDVIIEGKTNSGSYVTIATFTQATDVASQSVDVGRMPQNFRVSWAIGGTTPDITFEIDAIVEIGP